MVVILSSYTGSNIVGDENFFAEFFGRDVATVIYNMRQLTQAVYYSREAARLLLGISGQRLSSSEQVLVKWLLLVVIVRHDSLLILISSCKQTVQSSVSQHTEFGGVMRCKVLMSLNK